MDKIISTEKIELGSAMSSGNVYDFKAKQKENKKLGNDVEAFLKAGGKIKQA